MKVREDHLCACKPPCGPPTETNGVILVPCKEVHSIATRVYKDQDGRDVVIVPAYQLQVLLVGKVRIMTDPLCPVGRDEVWIYEACPDVAWVHGDIFDTLWKDNPHQQRLMLLHEAFEGGGPTLTYEPMRMNLDKFFEGVPLA